MVFITAFLLNSLYMLAPLPAFPVTAVCLILVPRYLAKDADTRWILRLLLSVPLLGTSIFGPHLHHIVNWHYIILALFTLRLLTTNFPVRPLQMMAVAAAALFTGLSLLNDAGAMTAAAGFDSIRIGGLLLVYVLTYAWMKERRPQVHANRSVILDTYVYVVAGTVAAMVVQFLMYRLFGQAVGSVTFFRLRTSYDVLFTAYSTMSIFIFSGAFLGLTRYQETDRWRYLLFSVFMVVLSALNTARSGIFAFVATLAIVGLLLLLHPQIRLGLDKIVAAFVVLGASVASIVFLFATRQNLESLFYVNMRDTLISEGLVLVTENVRSFLFGIGYSRVEELTMLPHNLFTQLFVVHGAVGVSVVSFLLFYALWKNRMHPTLLSLLLVLIGGQFVTSIYLTSYLFPLFLLSLIPGAEEQPAYAIATDGTKGTGTLFRIGI